MNDIIINSQSVPSNLQLKSFKSHYDTTEKHEKNLKYFKKRTVLIVGNSMLNGLDEKRLSTKNAIKSSNISWSHGKRYERLSETSSREKAKNYHIAGWYQRHQSIKILEEYWMKSYH